MLTTDADEFKGKLGLSLKAVAYHLLENTRNNPTNGGQMKVNRSVLLILAFFFTVMHSNQADAALTAYLQLAGADQGPIKGDCKQAGREDTILVYSVGHNLYRSFDTATGIPTGSPTHTPLQILKHTDNSSPLLNHALNNGEIMSQFILKFYRINDTGQEEHYYTIRLENARIVKITPSLPTTFLDENKPYRFMETVSFTYTKVIWTYEVDGIQAEAVW